MQNISTEKQNGNLAKPLLSPVRVFNGDCLEVMKSIPEGSIDMVLCDLPYGTTQCKWDVIIPFDKLWEQYERIIKSNGVIALSASQPFTTSLIYSNLKIFKYELIWIKTMPSGLASSSYMPMKYHENICIFIKKGKPTFNKQMQERSESGKERMKKSGKILNGNLSSGTHNPFKDGIKNTYSEYDKTKVNPKSILEFKSVSNSGGTKLHPTQKPIELFEYLIKTYTNENETVLDNTAGSGTTGIACINTNRNCILIEKEEKYFDIINERIAKHTQQRAGEFSFENEL